MKTYQIRLFPSKSQVDNLNELSSIRSLVWNELLHIQQKSYESKKTIYNKFDLNNMLPKLKEKYPSWKKINSNAL